LFPRGGESDYTLVLLDGLRLNAFGGGIDAAHLSPAGVERVEVVRGPQSALYGADAIGGVLQVVTRRGGPLSLGALAEAGSQETARAAGDTSGGARGWSWHGSGQYQQAQGRNGERSEAGEVVANDDYAARQVTAGGGWRGPSRDLRGFVHASSTARGNPGPFGSDPNGTFAGIDRVARGTTDHLGAALAASQTVGSTLLVRASATLADFDSGYASAWGSTFTETRRGTGRVQADWTATARVAVSGGAELLRERARNTYIVGATAAPVPIERGVAGLFGETRYQAGERLLVAAGVRAEHIARDRLEGAPGGFSPRPDFTRDTVTSVNPKLSVSWMVRPMGTGGRASTRLKANAGTGIRPPDAFEIAFTDNPGLKPERSRSLDVGVEQVLARGRVVVEATWFANRYDDLIVAVGPAFADASRYRTDNISNARSRGLEVAGAVRWPAGLALRAGYTHLRTEILAVDRGSAAPPPFSVGQPLLRRPRHQGFVDATVVRDRVDGFFRVALRGEVLDVDPSFGAFGGTLTAPGFTTADAGITWRPFARARHALFARITNLFDRTYEEAFGFPSPGRAAVVGVRLAHGR
jgi:outer membrane cobalamin receptor